MWDYIVVGAGPGGLMFTSQLATFYPDRTFLILERNQATLQTYLEKGYGQLPLWMSAMTDPQFSQSFLSTEKKTIWYGQGVGGGTNHFGLQFINTPDVIDNGYSEWQGDFDAVTLLLQPQKYTSPPNSSWASIETLLHNEKDENGFQVYSNHVYAEDLISQKRLVLGDSLDLPSNVQIQYDTWITDIVWKDNVVSLQAQGVVDQNGTLYEASTLVLAAGAIQTPVILQRSGMGPSSLLSSLSIPLRLDLPVGEQLFDHAGLTVAYTKIPLTSLLLDSLTLQRLYQLTGRYFYIVQGQNIPDEDRGYIWDFTPWIDQHPGGKDAIRQWVNKDFILQYPHDAIRWNTYKSKLGVKLGKEGDIVDILALPADVQLALSVSEVDLDPQNVVGYLQTRNPPQLTWQTYWNAMPNAPQTLLVTYALSTQIPKTGNVRIQQGDDDGTLSVLPKVALEELNSDGIAYLLDSIRVTEDLLTKDGWTRVSPTTPRIDASYIAQNYDSIYHYHGTCAIGQVVDTNHKVLGTDNVYISDISVLPKPWGGSTSVPSLVVGYRLAAFQSSLS